MKYKQGFTEETLEGGVADKETLMDLAKKHAYDDSTDSTSKEKIKDMYKTLKLQLDKGIRVEMEHTKSRIKAKEIAMDHLSEDPKYYDKLSKIETKEENQNSNDKEMVDGIINIVKQVKDLENRTTIAKNMVKQLKREKVNFDHDKFLELCGIKKEKKSETKEALIVKPVSKKFVEKFLGKNGETKEATGSGSSGAYVGPVFGGDDEFWERSRSETPKLEEQRRKKMKMAKEIKKATNNEGNTFKVGDKAKTYDRKENITIKALWEKNGKTKAFYMTGNVGHEIDIDGLDPIKEQVEKVEATEATGSGSVGGYETPAMWAKSTKKKDWGPSRKTQYKGGSFVKVKKKCTKFPYCNQGDINALKLSKNESVKEAIKNVAKKLNIGENVIITILEHEYEKKSKRNK